MEFLLSCVVWFSMLGVSFLIKVRVDKRLDPVAVERRYQNYRFIQTINKNLVPLKLKIERDL